MIAADSIALEDRRKLESEVDGLDRLPARM